MRLLLDEHLTPRIAEQLRAKGHDVEAVAASVLSGAPDDLVFESAIGQQRALLTNDVKDYIRFHRQCQAEGRSHYGLIFTSTKSMSGRGGNIGAFVRALAQLMAAHPGLEAMRDMVTWLGP